MAYPGYSRYQYETSPRKLEPKYKTTKKKVQKSTLAQRKKELAKRKKQHSKVIFALAVLFIAVFAISYRNSQIDEAFTKSEKLKADYQNIEKENEQIEVGIENSLNLNSIEQSAKEMLGMQKLNNKQTVYVELPKKDYIETKAETTNNSNNQGFFKRIINKIKSKF